LTGIGWRGDEKEFGVEQKIAVVDRGYKGIAIEGVKIYHAGLRRGITRGLRAMIRRNKLGRFSTDGSTSDRSGVTPTRRCGE
jgi:hypothetical protein